MTIKFKIKELILNYNNNIPAGKQKLTQIKLASIIFSEKKIGVAAVLINRWANNRDDHIRLEYLKRLAEFFKVQISDIIELS